MIPLASVNKQSEIIVSLTRPRGKYREQFFFFIFGKKLSIYHVVQITFDEKSNHMM